MKKIFFVLLLGLGSVRFAFSAEQIITATPNPQSLNPNQIVNLSINYSTANPTDATLTGLGLRLHWNSQQLTLNSISQILATGLLTQGNIEADTQDFDHDPATDQFIQVAWADVTGQWPNQANVQLYNVQWTTQAQYTGTTVRFSASSTAAGYTLQATPVIFTLNGGGNPPPATQPIPVLPWPLIPVLALLLGGIGGLSLRQR